MRPCTVKQTRTGELRPAKFHQFCEDVFEFETGACSFTAALVEYPDGTLEAVHPLHLVTFTDSTESQDSLASEKKVKDEKVKANKLLEFRCAECGHLFYADAASTSIDCPKCNYVTFV